MFRTDLLSIIRNLITVFTAINNRRFSHVECLSILSSILTSLAVNITSMTNTHCREYSIKNPDDGQ
jgi:hypothetical protein